MENNSARYHIFCIMSDWDARSSASISSVQKTRGRPPKLGTKPSEYRPVPIGGYAVYYNAHVGAQPLKRTLGEQALGSMSCCRKHHVVCSQPPPPRLRASLAVDLNPPMLCMRCSGHGSHGPWDQMFERAEVRGGSQVQALLAHARAWDPAAFRLGQVY